MIIILDWDGTVVDSADRIVRCMQAACHSAGLPPPAPAAVRQIIGLGLPEAIRALYPAIDEPRLELVREGYSVSYRDFQGGLPPLFPGVLSALESWGSRGVVLAVATGKSRRGLDRELRSRGMADCFAITRCADETASKPHPMMLHEILRESAMQPGDAIMVGDTEFDMEMASRAGVRKVAVTYGAHSEDQLRRHEPDLLVDQFSTILDWISGLEVAASG